MHFLLCKKRTVAAAVQKKKWLHFRVLSLDFIFRVALPLHRVLVFLVVATKANDALSILLAVSIVFVHQLARPGTNPAPDTTSNVVEQLDTVLDLSHDGVLHVVQLNVLPVHQVLLDVVHQVATVADDHVLELAFGLVLPDVLLHCLVQQPVEDLVKLVDDLLAWGEGRLKCYKSDSNNVRV